MEDGRVQMTEREKDKIRPAEQVFRTHKLMPSSPVASFSTVLRCQRQSPAKDGYCA